MYGTAHAIFIIKITLWINDSKTDGTVKKYHSKTIKSKSGPTFPKKKCTAVMLSPETQNIAIELIISYSCLTYT